MPKSLVQWEVGRQGTQEQWEGQDLPWQPGSRLHAGDSSPSRKGHGDVVCAEEEDDEDQTDLDGEGMQERGSVGHLADQECS